MWVNEMHTECKVYVRRHDHKISKDDVSFLWYVRFDSCTKKKKKKKGLKDAQCLSAHMRECGISAVLKLLIGATS